MLMLFSKEIQKSPDRFDLLALVCCNEISTISQNKEFAISNDVICKSLND